MHRYDIFGRVPAPGTSGVWIRVPYGYKEPATKKAKNPHKKVETQSLESPLTTHQCSTSILGAPRFTAFSRRRIAAARSP
uniref:Uncharacterized protein n=1 Tax=Fagus sylvatica TaxID=28930 RepID=A0A2N9H803_FAGSY